MDFYFANSEVTEVVARLEKLGKNKIERKKDYNNK